MKVSPKQNQGLPSKRSSMSPVMPYSNSHVSLPGSMPTLDQMGMDVTGLEEVCTKFCFKKNQFFLIVSMYTIKI